MLSLYKVIKFMSHMDILTSGSLIHVAHIVSLKPLVRLQQVTTRKLYATLTICLVKWLAKKHNWSFITTLTCSQRLLESGLNLTLSRQESHRSHTEGSFWDIFTNWILYSRAATMGHFSQLWPSSALQTNSLNFTSKTHFYLHHRKAW